MSRNGCNVMTKKKYEVRTKKELCELLYFGQYGLEDLKVLHSLKPKYQREHIDKMINRMQWIMAHNGFAIAMFRCQ